MAQENDYVIDLPPEYYPAIGEFIFRVAQLENQVHEILWRAINIDNKQGRVLTIGADAKVIRAMLGTVLSDSSKGRWVPDAEKSIKNNIGTLLNKSKEHVKLRNQLAHGTWQVPINPPDSKVVRLLSSMEQDEKVFTRPLPHITNAYIHQQCGKVKALNRLAQMVLHDLYTLRGMSTRGMHRPKNLSQVFGQV